MTRDAALLKIANLRCQTNGRVRMLESQFASAGETARFRCNSATVARP
jgi:hypothetical protein